MATTTYVRMDSSACRARQAAVLISATMTNSAHPGSRTGYLCWVEALYKSIMLQEGDLVGAGGGRVGEPVLIAVEAVPAQQYE